MPASLRSSSSITGNLRAVRALRIAHHDKKRIMSKPVAAQPTPTMIPFLEAANSLDGSAIVLDMGTALVDLPDVDVEEYEGVISGGDSERSASSKLRMLG